MLSTKMAFRCLNSAVKLNKGFSIRGGICYSTSGDKSWIPREQVTHTGQKWDEKDYRLARFIDKEKQVNPNWAINLISEMPPKIVKERVVWCDGGGGPTGHPKVYINLDKPGCHSCNYCGLRFQKCEDHH